MKRTLMLIGALTLFAPSAFAVGADLSVFACPDGPGASFDAGALDCAGGEALTLIATFMPQEALPDLAGIDLVFDLGINGDVNSDATFWDFANANSAALGTLQTRLAIGCNAYTDTWASPEGSGSGALGVYQSPARARIVALAYRPSPLAVLANEKLFGLRLTIDASTSLEAGGTTTGCSKSVCIVLDELFPRTFSGNDGTALTSGSVFGNQVIINAGPFCFVIPTRKRTWGQLKSLYR